MHADAKLRLCKEGPKYAPARACLDESDERQPSTKAGFRPLVPVQIQDVTSVEVCEEVLALESQAVCFIYHSRI